MSEALRVFYNASAVPAQPAGAGIYTLELGKALASRDDIELSVWSPRPLGFGEPFGSAATPHDRYAWEFLARGPGLRISGAEVYHGPHMFTPKSRVPTVATIHDLTFFCLPKRYRWRHRQYYRHLARSARRADRIIVPSATVATDAVRYLGIEPATIRVIHEAPRAGLRPAPESEVSAFRSRSGLTRPYLLCLGTAEPGKRAVDAIRAMPAILEAVPGTLLALAGNPGRLSAALEREADTSGVRDQVRSLGYVPDDDLPALITGASALIFPSLYEGFGLPPLEAMACGTPVITASAPAMTELLGRAAEFVPLRDPGAIARTAIQFLTEPSFRAERSAAGLELAARFSWERAAAETTDVYREVAR